MKTHVPRLFEAKARSVSFIRKHIPSLTSEIHAFESDDTNTFPKHDKWFNLTLEPFVFEQQREGKSRLYLHNITLFKQPPCWA